MEVDVEVIQEQPRGKRADKMDLGATLFPAFAETCGTKQSVRGFGSAVRALKQIFMVGHGRAIQTECPWSAGQASTVEALGKDAPCRQGKGSCRRVAGDSDG